MKRGILLGIALYLMVLALILFWANLSSSKFIYVDF